MKKNVPIYAAILTVFAIAALLLGLSLALLPYKLSFLLAILILGSTGLLVAVVARDRSSENYKVVYLVLVAALAGRFLWPNFAYVPIYALPSKSPQRWLWALCIAYWLYSLLVHSELRSRLATRLTRPSIAWLMAAFVGWRLLAAASGDLAVASLYVMAGELFDYVPAFLFALTWVRDVRDAERLAFGLVLVALIVGLLTGIELIVKQNLFMQIAPYDINNEGFLMAALEAKQRGGSYRAQASFNHPLLLAQFAVTVLPLVAFHILRGQRWQKRALASLVLLLVIVMLWASRTRTAIGVSGFVVATLILCLAANMIAERRSGIHRPLLGGLWLLAGFTAFVAIIAAIYVLTAGRTAEEVSSSMGRLAMLQRATVAALAHPLLGYGIAVGNLQAANYNSRGWATLDSYFLTQLLEAGIPALLLYITLLALCASAFVRQVFAREPTREGLLVAMWGLAMIAFGMSSLILSTPHNMPLFYLGVGVVGALSCPSTGDVSLPRRSALMRRGTTAFQDVART